MNSSLDNALLDVRKAYRLLADYQQRIIELLALIRSDLGAEYYFRAFRNGARDFNASIERSNNAGQSFLPMADVSVLWRRDAGQESPEHFHRTGDLLIDAWVRSDTGNGQNGEPELSVNESTSELRIYFFLCVKPSIESNNWYAKVWNRTTYPKLGEAKTCDKTPGYRIYGEALQLTDLADENAVHNAVNSLRERASSKLEYAI